MSLRRYFLTASSYFPTSTSTSPPGCLLPLSKVRPRSRLPRRMHALLASTFFLPSTFGGSRTSTSHCKEGSNAFHSGSAPGRCLTMALLLPSVDKYHSTARLRSFSWMMRLV
ncbi:uncharacterized protein PODANS_7_6290 [Podospora anserina S mat+]|uniref:Podospora anserina S mat+ genomic DNA chromosome 7, supercontig 1 n=1 Tax=Podospora anserina (strain S / ATCC MYA-4624 / DSM 980 / FGSC 10383) TaxID=515849 RepID=B2AW84_PODAN|nr:uncharacterized protein PODANS_7_6290 [Podospora anserina S mat+]CAP68658.1 unnamed protein product [Podospora anserina S mat+]CDP32129.1 Putative protein of unknown function [Podospora anserina S mat+]